MENLHSRIGKKRLQNRIKQHVLKSLRRGNYSQKHAFQILACTNIMSAAESIEFNAVRLAQRQGDEL